MINYDIYLMNSKNILVTGASGLIGSEVVSFFCELGFRVFGIDNNMRKIFFGPNGSTSNNLIRLQNKYQTFSNHNVDIRERSKVDQIIRDIKPFCLIHAAAQPSHDKAASIPHLDFEVNAVGTLNLLEATRNFSKDTIFIHLSTNKVYGDTPNSLEILELETRWELKGDLFKKGINESMSIDNSTHSLFGVSKVASDLLVQEYGRYFNIPTCCLRGGCLTGPSHSGVELHGFLNYLIKCNLKETKYNIYGYKGKQVRDNIHSFDVANFIYQFSQKPKVGAVYNIGGGYFNSVSILEAITKVEELSGKKMNLSYLDKPRIGDHICYYSNLQKIKKDYPNWKITRSIDYIFEDVFKGNII